MRKVLKNGKRLVADRYSLRRARFAKYRFSNVHILHFRCFIPCFGYRTEEYLICSFQYMFIHFVSYRYVSQNTVKPHGLVDYIESTALQP